MLWSCTAPFTIVTRLLTCGFVSPGLYASAVLKAVSFEHTISCKLLWQRLWRQEETDSMDDVDLVSCRICFEEGHGKSQLVSPCKCKGTQEYVHLHCLRMWQDNVLRWGDGTDQRAYYCNVCKAPYSVAPSRPTWPGKLVSGFQGVTVALCISMVAVVLSGPPWPHLAVVLLVVLCLRYQLVVFTCWFALFVLFVLVLYFQGFRLVLRLDHLGRFGPAIIRHGPPVDGLHPGVLLVASAELENTVFHQSVVLIYEHSQLGAKGVLLTQPVDPARFQGSLGFVNRQASVTHYLGGPVEAPRRHVVMHAPVVLHNMPDVVSSHVVLGPGVNGSGSAEGFVSRLDLNGSLADVTRVLHSLDRLSPNNPNSPTLKIFYGLCVWSSGQLEGEVRNGAWGFANATVADVLNVPPTTLWWNLLSSERLQWM